MVNSKFKFVFRHASTNSVSASVCLCSPRQALVEKQEPGSLAYPDSTKAMTTWPKTSINSTAARSNQIFQFHYHHQVATADVFSEIQNRVPKLPVSVEGKPPLEFPLLTIAHRQKYYFVTILFWSVKTVNTGKSPCSEDNFNIIGDGRNQEKNTRGKSVGVLQCITIVPIIVGTETTRKSDLVGCVVFDQLAN